MFGVLCLGLRVSRSTKALLTSYLGGIRKTYGEVGVLGLWLHDQR